MKVIEYLKQGVAFTEGVRRIWLIHLMVSICYVGFSLLFVFCCKQAIDIATGRSEGNLVSLTWGLFAVVLLQIVCSALKSWLTADCEVKLKNHLRVTFFSFLLESRNLSRRMHTGDVVNRLDDDVRIVAEVLGKTIPVLLSTILQFLLAFYYLYQLEPSLAGIIVLIMPVCLALSKLMVRHLKDQTAQIRKEEAQVQTFLQEHIQHLTLLQTLQQEKRVGGLLEDAQSRLYDKVSERTRSQVIARVWVSGAFAIGYVVAFTWGVSGILSGYISFGMLTAFLQLASQIQNPLLEMSRRFPSLVHAMASVDRLVELKLEREACVEKNQQILQKPVGIAFNNVCFTYPDGEQAVINDFSYNISPSGCVAILGESGKGKTTLIRLLLALYSPQQGDIYLYNASEKVKISSATRSNFVYVPQGNTMLNGTIRDNLLLGNPEATEEELKEVLRVVVADFVEQLPLGLDTLCSEQGGGLSEGQAQRIAIARALLRKGSIFLFDEITAALDADTEQRLVENLISYCAGATLIFITHRPYILSHCKAVLKLED